MKTIYTCNVNPNSTDQEPLGLPVWNFGKQAPQPSANGLPENGTGNDNTDNHNSQNETQEPLGLPSMFDKE